MLKRYSIRDYNFILVFYLIALTVLGILVIGSAQEGGNQTKQIAGLILGLAAMLIISLMDYSFILRFSWLWYVGDVVLLTAVIAGFGASHKGATRWIEIAGIQFQPSELSKIILILFFAAFLQKYREKVNSLKVLFVFAVCTGIPLLLVIREPDLSTTIVTALICLSLLFIGGLSYKIVISVLAVSIPSVIIFISLILQPDQKILDDYAFRRIMAWLDPAKYADDAYQQQNSIMAIGSGQLVGQGLNNNSVYSVKNGGFIAETETDFIFAVAGEELGFVGCATIILLLALIVLECIWIGKRSRDFSGTLICCGVAGYIGFQSFINICVATGIMPNTGIPLPFVSYGMTSLVTLFMAVGFVLNVGLQPKKY